VLDPGEEAQVRRALRQARRSARAEGRTWVLVYVLPAILVAGLPWPRPVTLLLACCFLALLIVTQRRRMPQDLRGPLRVATVERVVAGEVIIRLDDGALWGFVAALQAVGRLRRGEELTLPMPAPGSVVAARRNPVTEAWEPLAGSDCRLYRPAPTSFVAPLAAVAAPETTELSLGQAQAFLAHEVGLLSGPRKLSPRRRAALADIGTEPVLDVVEVAEYVRRRAVIRRTDGRRFSWPVAKDAVLLGQGRRVWATRVEEGLYVVLVATLDEGRRAELIWPTGPAVGDTPGAAPED